MLKLKENIGYENSGLFSQLFLDYVANNEKLKSSFNLPPTLESLGNTSKLRNFHAQQRKVLVDTLEKQYRQVEHTDKTSKALQNLALKNTFTITTGHQLNLFTGPLYFVYKILTAIKLANDCNKAFPDRNFVPVYWMASEDHDFDEINAFFFENRTYKWPTVQQGPVGRFQMDDIAGLMDNLPFDFGIFQEFYTNSTTLAEAHFKMVHHLFKDFGLIILDPDKKSLKEAFSPVMRRDIYEEISYQTVESQTKVLTNLGYKIQVHAREINYFYINDNGRFRILKDQEKYGFITAEGKSIEIDLDEILKNKPEAISPNVITRPLYQEYILPNLAYIGGPAEMAYWLQFKGSFDALNIQYPILFPRLSATILNEKSLSTLSEYKIKDLSQIFLSFESLKKALLLQDSEWNENEYLEWSRSLNELMVKVEQTLGKLDATLVASAKGRHKKMQKELDKLRKKGQAAAIKQKETAIDKLYKIHQEIFPAGALQERKTNILSLLFSDQNIIKEMYDALGDPFLLEHKILTKAN